MKSGVEVEMWGVGLEAERREREGKGRERDDEWRRLRGLMRRGKRGGVTGSCVLRMI